MKRINVVTILLSYTIILVSSNAFAQSAEDILAQVEQNNRNTTLISYKAEYKSINPTVNDSIFNASGTVWLKKMPADSIFGAYFHIKGEEESEKFDYLYDGQNSYEIRHEDKKITIFNPHEHPNTPNNPAKARTALTPFQEPLLDYELKTTILEDHSNVFINENQSKWIITVAYPENQHGQEVTKSLEVDKNTFLIHRINQKVKWRGTTFSTQITLSNYQQDNSSIADEIYLSKSYEEYSKEEFRRETTGSMNPYENLIGKSAPAFTFTSFSGNEISLSQFKGKVVLLDFWESWCGYCIMAMPKLNKLQNRWKDTLTIIGVVTENKQPVEKLIKTNGLIYPNIFANRDIIEAYNVSARPTYVLIDQAGKIITITTGNLDPIVSNIRQLVN